MKNFENCCEKYGFMSDSNKKKLCDIFNNLKFQAVHIDVYLDEPQHILFLRTIEKDVSVESNKDRLVLRKKDCHKTVLMNIPKTEIINCMIKQCTDSQYEIVFRVKYVWYKLLIII